MEDKKQTAQELNLDQMDQISGGTAERAQTCPWCGQSFSGPSQFKSYLNHMNNCPKKPANPTVLA